MYFILSQANLEPLKLLKSKEFSTPYNACWEGSEGHPLSSVLCLLLEYTPWFCGRFYDRTTLNSLFRTVHRFEKTELKSSAFSKKLVSDLFSWKSGRIRGIFCCLKNILIRTNMVWDFFGAFLACLPYVRNN